MRILLIEDDPELRRVLARGFTEEGFDVETAGTFDGGRRRAVLGSFDVLVLDVMLPGGSGYELCRHVREHEVATPILMLTARGAVDERVEGLESGADDYLTKPFHFRELLARVRALGRRPPGLAPELYELADLRVDLRTRRVARSEDEIRLTTKEWELLEFLVRNADRVVSRGEISDYVWDENHDPFSNVLEVLIGRLRRKLDDPYDRPLVHTVRGAGYRFGP